jgi:hypothetical protein
MPPFAAQETAAHRDRSVSGIWFNQAGSLYRYVAEATHKRENQSTSPEGR